MLKGRFSKIFLFSRNKDKFEEILQKQVQKAKAIQD